MTLWWIQTHQASLAATCVLGKECGLPSTATPKTVAYSMSPLTLWGSGGTLNAERKGKAFCERVHRSSLAEDFVSLKKPCCIPWHSRYQASEPHENVRQLKLLSLIKEEPEDIIDLIQISEGLACQRDAEVSKFFRRARKLRPLDGATTQRQI